MPAKISALNNQAHQYANMGKIFARALLRWNLESNQRKMPWKGEKDPYKIWLSEIILQQTRVEQGLKYYENFITLFPDVHALAGAPDDRVFKTWEGLGYYSRCKNLIISARFISKELRGQFPDTYESIKSLKGVGPYTAAAISSFAYNLPHAVLDGNVFRVLSRIFEIDIPIDSSEGKEIFSELSQQMLPVAHAGEYNQAIMDFGATICKPAPECSACFFNIHCHAYLAGRQDLLPVKKNKIKIKQRWFHYFIIRHEDAVLLRKRSGRDIWRELFEFVLIETDKACPDATLTELIKKQYGIDVSHLEKKMTVNQKLTHQSIQFSFFRIFSRKKIMIPGFFWVKLEELDDYAFPKTLQQAIAALIK
jgi:A/G-specific adenine glycosylase